MTDSSILDIRIRQNFVRWTWESKFGNHKRHARLGPNRFSVPLEQNIASRRSPACYRTTSNKISLDPTIHHFTPCPNIKPVFVARALRTSNLLTVISLLHSRRQYDRARQKVKRTLILRAFAGLRLREKSGQSERLTFAELMFLEPHGLQSRSRCSRGNTFGFDRPTLPWAH